MWNGRAKRTSLTRTCMWMSNNILGPACPHSVEQSGQLFPIHEPASIVRCYRFSLPINHRCQTGIFFICLSIFDHHRNWITSLLIKNFKISYQCLNQNSLRYQSSSLSNQCQLPDQCWVKPVLDISSRMIKPVLDTMILFS